MRYSENFQGLFSCQTQDRKVALSEELFASLKKYLDETIDLRTDNLFTSDGNSPLTAKRFRLLLTSLWTTSGLKEPAPRMADFRHSFITLRLLHLSLTPKSLGP